MGSGGAGGDGDAWADQEQGNGGSRGGEAKRSEIYTYEAGWHIYGMNWSVQRDKKYRLAIASLLEQLVNRVEVVQLDESSGDIAPVLSFDHPFPPTKSMFVPDPHAIRPDLLATSADLLRIWRITSPDDDDASAAANAGNSNSGSVRCNGVGGAPGQQPGVELRCELNGAAASSPADPSHAALAPVAYVAASTPEPALPSPSSAGSAPARSRADVDVLPNAGHLQAQSPCIPRRRLVAAACRLSMSGSGRGSASASLQRATSPLPLSSTSP